VTQDDVDRVRQIARDVYGFDAGVPSQTLDEQDLKVMTKLDWNVNDDHHVSAKYQRTSGNVLQDSPAFGTNLPLTSNWYDQRDGLHAFAARVNSDWTTNLATEAEISGKIVDSRPTPVNGNGFQEATITTPDGGTIVLGPDPFRHANELDNDALHGKVQADYLLGTHLLVGGVEYDYVNIFNLFVPSSHGEANYDSIDAFEMQTPASIFYSNAVTNNPDDAAASFNLGTFSSYVQDQWAVTSELTAQAGLRFEVYTAENSIPENSNFVDR
jgi:hypothetical protein